MMLVKIIMPITTKNNAITTGIIFFLYIKSFCNHTYNTKGIMANNATEMSYKIPIKKEPAYCPKCMCALLPDCIINARRSNKLVAKKKKNTNPTG